MTEAESKASRVSVATGPYYTPSTEESSYELPQVTVANGFHNFQSYGLPDANYGRPPHSSYGAPPINAYGVVSPVHSVPLGDPYLVHGTLHPGESRGTV